MGLLRCAMTLSSALLLAEARRHANSGPDAVAKGSGVTADWRHLTGNRVFTGDCPSPTWWHQATC